MVLFCDLGAFGPDVLQQGRQERCKNVVDNVSRLCKGHPRLKQDSTNCRAKPWRTILASVERMSSLVNSSTLFDFFHL